MSTPTPEQREFYASVLATAVEQRVTSFHYEGYAWDAPLPRNVLTAASVAAYDLDTRQVLKTVASSSLHATFVRLLTGPVNGLHERLRSRYVGAWLTNDAGDIDAADADYILQLHVLGEVIYG